jgi:hypothetical protein
MGGRPTQNEHGRWGVGERESGAAATHRQQQRPPAVGSMPRQLRRPELDEDEDALGATLIMGDSVIVSSSVGTCSPAMSYVSEMRKKQYGTHLRMEVEGSTKRRTCSCVPS